MFRKLTPVLAPLAALLVMAVNASSQTKGCNCANASLVGDTVGTRFNQGPGPINKVVGAGIELQGAGPVLAPTGGNLNWQAGNILVKLNFASDIPTPSPTLDPCCPPWNKYLLTDMMFLKGSGSISEPYTLRFQPTTVFNNQMQAYINYVHSVNPLFASIGIAFILYDFGRDPNLPKVTGTIISPTASVTWNQNSTGIGDPVISPKIDFFDRPMQVGTWYAVVTGIYIENEQRFFPDKCDDNLIYVRVQVLPAKGAVAKRGPVLEFSDGKKVIKSLPIGESKQQQR